MSATTTWLLSSGEFCKLRYDTIPIKSASVNISFFTTNSKIPNFYLWHSCRKWAVWNRHVRIEHYTDCLQKNDYSSLLQIIKGRHTALVRKLLYYDTVYPAAFFGNVSRNTLLTRRVDGNNVFFRNVGTHLKVQQSRRIQYEPDAFIQMAAYSDPLPFFRYRIY